MFLNDLNEKVGKELKQDLLLIFSITPVLQRQVNLNVEKLHKFMIKWNSLLLSHVFIKCKNWARIPRIFPLSTWIWPLRIEGILRISEIIKTILSLKQTINTVKPLSNYSTEGKVKTQIIRTKLLPNYYQIIYRNENKLAFRIIMATVTPFGLTNYLTYNRRPKCFSISKIALTISQVCTTFISGPGVSENHC